MPNAFGVFGAFTAMFSAMALTCCALGAGDDVTITHYGTTHLIVTAPATNEDPNISARLHGRMQVDVTEAGIDEVAAVLRAAMGVNVVVDPGLRTRNPLITLKLKDVTGETFLKWACVLGKFKAPIEGQAVFLTDTVTSPSMGKGTSTTIYDVSDVIGQPRDMPSPLAMQQFLPGSGAGGAGAAAPALFTNNIPGTGDGDSPEARITKLEELLRAQLKLTQQ